MVSYKRHAVMIEYEMTGDTNGLTGRGQRVDYADKRTVTS